MQSIGERLEDARKRQGISVREAAEATKIRADFLIEFENNNFNQDLPEIYKRGFLKLYAKFLGLDGDRLVADYHSLVLGHSPIPQKTDNREYLGRVETNPTQDTAYIIPEEEEDYATDGYSSSEDKTLYLKIGIAVGSTVLVLVLLAIIIKIASGGSDPEPAVASETTTTAPGSSNVPGGTSPQDAVEEIVILEAQEDMTIVVRLANAEAPLYSGPLLAGESKEFTKKGPIDIASTVIDKLVVIRNGERFAFEGTGVQRRRLP